MNLYLGVMSPALPALLADPAPGAGRTGSFSTCWAKLSSSSGRCLQYGRSLASWKPCAPHPSHLSSSGYVHHGVFLMGLAGVNAARALDVSSAGRTSVIFCKKKTQNTEKNPIRLKAPKLEMWKFLKKIFEKKKKISILSAKTSFL